MMSKRARQYISILFAIIAYYIVHIPLLVVFQQNRYANALMMRQFKNWKIFVGGTGMKIKLGKVLRQYSMEI